MERIAKSTLPYFLGMDLADLSEGVPLSEENGFADFMAEARKLAAAAEDAGIDLRKTTDQRGPRPVPDAEILSAGRVPRRRGGAGRPAG